MIKSFCFVLILWLATLSLHAQNYVKITDSKSGAPVEGVVLISDSFSSQSDENGKASMDGFLPGEKILFKHSSYLSLTTTREKISKQGNAVILVENPVRLDEVVVSVNRWAESKSEIPHYIQSIQAEQIQHYNPQTSADLLGNQNGIFIQKSQMGGGSPMIRGFSANSILLVVDGIRMNNAIYRSGNLHNVISVDAQSLESAEVIFGPGSVIYGSDALGGVMSFNTVNPKLSTTSKTESSGKVFTRYSSANMEQTVHGTYNVGGEKWGAVLSTTYTDFDDLRMGSQGPDAYLRPQYVANGPFNGFDRIVANDNDLVQKYTGYSQFNLLGKLRYRPSDRFDLVFSANHSRTGDIPRYDRLIEHKNDRLAYAEWYYGPQIWTLASVRAQYTAPHLLFDRISLQVGYQDYTESRNDRKLNNENLRSREENVKVFSSNLDFAKEFDEEAELFYGVETYLNNVGSGGISKNLLSGETENIAPRYPDGSTYNSFAAYSSLKYNVSPKFIAQVGARFTYTQLEGVFDKQYYNFPFDGFNMDNSAFNGNLGVVWHPTKDWQINLHGSTGFRSPNIDDIAKVFDSEPGNVVVPNPDLKPEYARNLEINVLRNIHDHAKFEITGFYSWLKDAMVRRDFSLNGQDYIMYDGELSKVEALVNAESAKIYGMNLNLEILFGNNWRTRHDISLTRGEDSDGFPMRHVPPTFGSSHLVFENQTWYVDLFLNYNGKLNYNDLAPDEQDKPHLYLPDENGNPHLPSWWTLNLKSNYRIHPKITLGAGVENIFDKRYRPYSSGIVAPGVNFMFSALFKI